MRSLAGWAEFDPSWFEPDQVHVVFDVHLQYLRALLRGKSGELFKGVKVRRCNGLCRHLWRDRSGAFGFPLEEGCRVAQAVRVSVRGMTTPRSIPCGDASTLRFQGRGLAVEQVANQFVCGWKVGSIGEPHQCHFSRLDGPRGI